MREGRIVSALLFAVLFGASTAFGCGSDAASARPGGKPCVSGACMPLAGNGGSSEGGEGGIANGGAAGHDDAGDDDAGDGGASGDGGGGGVVSPPFDLEKRVAEAVAKIQSDTCFAGDDTSLCAWSDYEIGPTQFEMAKSTTEAVLVIDDFGAGFYPQLVRYRNRLLGFYRVDEARVVSQVLSVHLPQTLGDVLVSFAGPGIGARRLRGKRRL